MRSVFWLALFLIPIACRPEVAPVAASVRPDSIVLVRTRCFGTCPAYRLRVTATGAIAFESHNPRDRTRGVDSIGPGVMDTLMARAHALGLFSLPDKIVRGLPHCGAFMTDHPSIRIDLFGSHRKTFDYNTGCYREMGTQASEPMQQLEAFAAAIDSLTGADRWIRPAGGR